MHTDTVHAVRLIGTDSYAREDSDGNLGWGSICASTLFFDPEEDSEEMFAHMSAAPGGHEAAEQVIFRRTLTPIKG